MMAASSSGRSAGGNTRESIMRVQSLSPELEFEVIKLILLRESYMKRLEKQLVAGKGTIDIGIVGMADTLRDVSLQVVETIQEWETSQVDYPALIKPFIWNGVEYTTKMRSDYEFLQNYPNVSIWLGFEASDNNPFFIPPEAMLEDSGPRTTASTASNTQLADNSFVVFGIRPPVPIEEAKRAAKAKFIKSPYLTPVLNDLRIFPELAAVNRIKKDIKTSDTAAAASASLTANARDKASGGISDPFESYVPAAVIKRAKACWRFMHQAAYRTNTTTFSLASSMSASQLMLPAAGASSPKSLRFSAPSSSSAGSPHALGSRLEEGSFELTGGGGGGMLPLGAIQEDDDQTLPPPPSTSQGNNIGMATVSIGELDLYGQVSRVSATSVFSKTRDEYTATSLGFHASLAESGHSHPLPNKAMRLEELTQSQVSGHQSSVHSGSIRGTNSVKTWTPHEVKLQKTVQRRGGELFVLTAAGTRGRIKAPWRKTRFQRLENDLEKIRMQGDMVAMALEESSIKVVEVSSNIRDKVQTHLASSNSSSTPSIETKEEDLAEIAGKIVDPGLLKLLSEKQNQVHHLQEMKKALTLNRELLEYQLNHFRKLVAGGNVASLDSLRKRHLLGEGEALESDNLVSMSVEDNAASIIQRTCRRVFGKAIRKMLMHKRNLAALKIQGFVRKKSNEGQAYARAAKLFLVKKLQKLWRGRGVRGMFDALRRRYLERKACAVFQRLVRGFLSRRRTRRKRLFLLSVASAANCVTLDDIAPSDVDKLADAVENFLTYYDEFLPMAVMTVLRGILYMFRGDEEESVMVENQGFREYRRFLPQTVTWFCLKQFLRRKGKFLRRIRALVDYINFPGPCRLTFTKSCQEHLDAVRAHVKVSDFDGMDEGPKETCIKLLHYIKHMKTAFDLQSEFPDYFESQTPNWYRVTLQRQMEYRKTETAYFIAKAAKERINEIRQEYQREGRRWGHVFAAEEQNKQDIKDTEKALRKAEDIYTKFVQKFIVEEKHDIDLHEGIARARVLGLEVAERDFKEYLGRYGDGDEKVVAMYRLNVDKKALSLLDMQTKIIRLKEAKAINEAARNFKKLIKLKHIKAVARNSGSLLGRMMVLGEVWKDFLLEIGGVQYIDDLVGKKKEIFENLRREIQELMQARRALNEDLDSTIRDQIQRCKQIALDIRVERTKLRWDNPTSLERDHELAEDAECAKRDADREGKAMRQARLVKVPRAVRSPILLIIDVRIPRILRDTLVSKLNKIRFEEVKGYITDPTIALSSQRILDAGLNLILFVDRGIHASARASFLGSFNAYVHSLIPFPRIIALDATLQVRYENWFSEYSLDRNELFNFNVENSTECGLLLGRLRRTAFMFKKCLLLDSVEEDRNEGATISGAVPDWLRARFREDLDDFMDEVHGDRDGDDAMSASSSCMEKSGMILVATISSIMGIWKAPLLPWKERQIQEGCNAFAERIADAPKLCDMLWLNPLPLCTQLTLNRLKVARSLAPAWRGISRLSFFKHPARYLLAQWCIETMTLMDQLAEHGGAVDEEYKFLPVSHVQHLKWVEDVCDADTRADHLVGALLQEAFSTNKVYETKTAVTEYEKTDELTDTTRQYFSSKLAERTCRVYYSGSDCYFSVSVEHQVIEKRRGKRGKKRMEVRNFYAYMDIYDLITMLQPNFTELYEGRLERFIIDGPKKTHNWWELLAKWGRLERVGKKYNLTLLRSRFLMSSTIGYLSGYLCRFEIFEERFAEILILIHGLPGVGTIYYSANRNEITKLLAYADEVEEKIPIENYDAQRISTIFSDRLSARPSLVQNTFLASGELQPKSLEKKVQIYLRTTGGPGRYVGRKLVKMQEGLLLIVTIFEIANSTDIYSLRIVIHEVKHQQTAEYRLSSLERVSLFSDEIPLVDQVVSKLRIVYCDFTDPSRTILPLEASSRPVINQEDILVEGQFEYDIFSAAELLEIKRRGVELKVEDLSDVEAGSEDGSLPGLPVEHSQISKLDSLEMREQPWGWGLYLNRFFVEESRGNLMVAATLILAREGFAFSVVDQRTLRESYRFLPFTEALYYLKGNRTEEQLVDELRNVEQATVYNLIDDLFSFIDVSSLKEIDGTDISEYEVSRLSLSNQDRHYTLAYCRSREAGEELDPEVKARRLAKFGVKKAAVYILAARELKSIGGVVAARNPFAIVKWNSREVGRTTPSRNDLNPEWEDPPMLMQSTKDKRLPQCTLEVEVWDWNVSTLRPADYLGGIKLTGDALVSFLESKLLKTLPLERSRRFNDEENKNVGGSLVIFGVLDGDISKTHVPQDYRDDADRVEADRKKREKELEQAEKERLAAERKAKGGFIGSMFGRSNKKKVTISAPKSSQEMSKIKFSERHRLADADAEADNEPEFDKSAKEFLDFDAMEGLVAPVDLEPMGETQVLPGDPEELERLRQAYADGPGENSEANEEGFNVEEQSVQGSLQSYELLQDDQSLALSQDQTASEFPGGNELFSLADRTMTDDSMTLAGYTESRHITLQFISAEGLPLDLATPGTRWIVRFNGFQAAEVAARLYSKVSSETIDQLESPIDEVVHEDGGEQQIAESEPVVEETQVVEEEETAEDHEEVPATLRERRLDLAGSIEFPSSAIVSMHVPPLLELASCGIEIELWATKTHLGEHQNICLGSADIRGSRLNSFIESRGFESTWLTLYDSEGLPVSSHNSFNDAVPLRVQVRGDLPGPEVPKVLKLDLSLLSVRNLPFSRAEAVKAAKAAAKAANAKGKKSAKSNEDDDDSDDENVPKRPSSLYVEVRFNDMTVGSTPPVPDSFDPYPRWTKSGKFEMKVPSEMTLAQCKLEIRVFSAKKMPDAKKGKKQKAGKPTFLGAKMLEGQALCNFSDTIPDEVAPEKLLAADSDSLIDEESKKKSMQPGILTASNTLLYGLHTLPLFENDPASKTIAPTDDIFDTLLELRGKSHWVEEEDWEMVNESTKSKDALVAPETEVRVQRYRLPPTPAEMRNRIAGMETSAAFGALPNTSISGTLVERPWSRLSRASLGRDIPEGQRANAMADVQDMSGTRLQLILQQVALETSSSGLQRIPVYVTGRVFFNEKCLGERLIAMDQTNAAPRESKLSNDNKEASRRPEGAVKDVEEPEDDDDMTSVPPATIVLFVPRGQKLASCTLEVELLHKGKPVGLITMDGAHLVELMVLSSVQSIEGQSLPKPDQQKKKSFPSTEAPTVAPAKDAVEMPVPVSDPAFDPAANGATTDYPIKAATPGTGTRALQVGTAQLSGVVMPFDSAFDEARQRFTLGASMHRRGAEDTQRRVEVKLLACQGLSGSLKIMHSPRINGSHSYGMTSSAGGDEDLVRAEGVSSVPNSPIGSSPASPAPSHIVPNKSTEKTVYAVVKWNGQEIRRSEKVAAGNDIIFKHHTPMGYSRDNKISVLEGSSYSNTFVMHVPRGHRLRGCYLEIVLWDGEVCLGSTLLHGEDLTMFLEGFGSVPEDIDFYSFYDPDDDIAQGHRSFPLQYSASVPQTMQGAVNGRIVLRGRVDPDPDPLARAAVQPRGGSALDCPYPKIRTNLPPETTGWRHEFIDEEKEGEEGDGLLQIGSSLETMSAVGPLTAESAASGIGQTRRKRRGAESGRQPFGVKFMLPEMESPLDGFVVSTDNTLKLRHLFLTKFRCELAAVTFLKYRSKAQEEDRVCWRGRGMPAEVKGLSDAQKGAMFKNRSSRVVRRGLINELRVVANIAYLEEISGEEESMQAALPIVVKEIVSDGPGIAQRVYRIEITTNAGASLGSADIVNDYEIIRAVGAEHVEIFGTKGRAEWPMPEIFGHIVNVRTQLDFAPPKRRGKQEAKSFMGMFQKKKDADAPVSVIKIIKDETVSEDVVKFAMEGGFLGGLTLEQMEAKKQEEARQKIEDERRAIFRKAVENKKRQKLGSGYTAAELEAHRAEVEEWVQRRDEKKRAKRAARRSRSPSKDKRQSIDSEDDSSVGAPANVSPATSAPSSRSNSPGRFGTRAFAGIGNLLSGASTALSSAIKVVSNQKPSTIEEEAAPVPVDVRERTPRDTWVRIYNLVHLLSGIKFRTVVLLCGMGPLLDTKTDEYFEQENLAGQKRMLSQLRVVIRAKDAYTAKVYELEFSGPEMVEWIGDKYVLDLRRKFRRMKFGEFVVSKMIMRFDSRGGYILDLMTDDMGAAKNASSVADKLARMRERDEAEKRKYEAEVEVALEAELRDERRQLWEMDNDVSSEEEEEKEEKPSYFGAGGAAAAAAKAAADALKASARAAGDAIKGMFSWGGGKKKKKKGAEVEQPAEDSGTEEG